MERIFFAVCLTWGKVAPCKMSLGRACTFKDRLYCLLERPYIPVAFLSGSLFLSLVVARGSQFIGTNPQIFFPVEGEASIDVDRKE